MEIVPVFTRLLYALALAKQTNTKKKHGQGRPTSCLLHISPSSSLLLPLTLALALALTHTPLIKSTTTMSKLSPLAASLPSAGPLYTAITSTWSGLGLPKPSIEHITWVPGKSAISTNKEVVICIATYLLVIFSGRELMR